MIGILYSNSPENDTQAVGILSYEGKLQTSFYRNFKKQKHTITPYVEYQGLTKPTVSSGNHYIFGLSDGYAPINIIKAGILNTLTSLNKTKGSPSLEIDAYTNLFLGYTQSPVIDPRAYVTLNANLPSIFLHTDTAWNINKKTMDFSNSQLGYTFSENIAVSVEYRYRSIYDWRKADHSNFILNSFRPQSELLNSPLSDKRSTFLYHFFVRVTPSWSLHVESHTGWGRKNNRINSEPSYDEYKIELQTLLNSGWKVKLSYEHTQKDDRFTFDYYLLKF